MRVSVTASPLRPGWFSGRVLLGTQIIYEATRASEAQARQAAEAWVAKAG